MKDILLSIKPYYYYLTAEGLKTVEIRKDYPKAADWSGTAHYYMSKDKKSFARIPKEFQEKYRAHFGKIGLRVQFDKNNFSLYESEFVNINTHEAIKEIKFDDDGDCYCRTIAENGEENDLCRRACLSWEEMRSYIGRGFHEFYAWHTAEVKALDRPRELGEFRKPCDWNYDCCTCKRAVYELTKAEARLFYGCDNEITRPPLSWQYVEACNE